MRSDFRPDLIVEVTSVCDRACVGCYAPNVINTLDSNDFYQKNRNLFLSNPTLASALLTLPAQVETASVRGGEPTQHPELVDILLTLSKYCSRIFLETHGRWILSVADQKQRTQILRGIKDNEVTVKLSFDRMHGLNSLQLKEITSLLAEHGIPFVVAVTEENEKDFSATLTQCDFISSEKIIFQNKGKQLLDLVRPKIGVINVKGEFSETLSVKPAFLVSTASERKASI